MFPHYITSKNGITLWQIGHYCYEISGKGVKEIINDNCEVAVERFNASYG